MKKFMLYALVCSFASLVVVVFASCATTSSIPVKDPISMVPSSADVQINIQANLAADLEVSNEKISFDYEVTMEELNRYSWEELKCIAVREALIHYGNTDVMVACQYKIDGSFDRTVTSYGKYGSTSNNSNANVTITVSGYPAKYKNFKTIE